MSSILLTMLVLVLAIGAIGLVSELPKVLSHHINQPVQRRRREAALRRKLVKGIAIGFVALAIAYAGLVAMGFY